MTKGIRLVGMIAVAVVAIVAAVVSYTHMQIVAERAGQGWRSWLEPLSVDGLLVGASLVVYVRRDARRAWLAVIIGILVSLVANLAAAQPTLISRLVSAWPAIALALSYETLLTLVRHPATEDPTSALGNESTPAPSVVEHHELVEHTPDTPIEPEPERVNGFTFGDPTAWARIASGSK